MTAEDVAAGPRTRADCIDGPRPCPWVGCRYHLARDVSPAGARVRVRDPGSLDETCALDVADRGPQSPPDIAALMGLGETMVFEALASGLRKMQEAMAAWGPEGDEDPEPEADEG